MCGFIPSKIMSGGKTSSAKFGNFYNRRQLKKTGFITDPAICKAEWERFISYFMDYEHKNSLSQHEWRTQVFMAQEPC